MEMTERMLSTRQAAQLMQVRPAYVRELCATGAIKAVQIGHEWRLRETHVTEWIQNSINEKMLPPIRLNEHGEKIYSTVQAARALGISPRLVAQHAEQLGGYKRAGKWCIPYEGVQAARENGVPSAAASKPIEYAQPERATQRTIRVPLAEAQVGDPPEERGPSYAWIGVRAPECPGDNGAHTPGNTIFLTSVPPERQQAWSEIKAQLLLAIGARLIEIGRAGDLAGHWTVRCDYYPPPDMPRCYGIMMMRARWAMELNATAIVLAGYAIDKEARTLQIAGPYEPDLVSEDMVVLVNMYWIFVGGKSNDFVNMWIEIGPGWLPPALSGQKQRFW